MRFWLIPERDANGNITKTTQNNEDDSYSVNEFDTDGYWIKGTYYNTDSSITRWLIPEYDGDGNCEY